MSVAQRADGDIRFLQRLALAAASVLDARELVRLVISETTDAMATDVCSVYLLSPDGDLVLTATNGLSQEGVGRVRLAVGEGVTGWAAAERRPVVALDVRREPRFRWLDGVDQERFVSMCSTPILSGDRLVGVMNVQTVREHRFGESEVSFMAAIAAHVAGALERSELQGRLEARVAELRRSEEVHRRLSALALAGAGLDAICDAVARTAGAPVAAYDADGDWLAGSARHGLPARLTGFADPERREDGLTVLPIRAGGERLGWLAAGIGGDEPAPARREALDHGLTVLALELVREREAAETERRLRGDLLEELLRSRLSRGEAERLAERAARLGHRLRGPVWVVLVEPDDEEAARALSAGRVRSALARALGDAIAQEVAGGLAVERGTGLVMLIPAAGADAERVERIARAAVAAAARLGGGASASAGIGSAPGGPVELHRLAEEARAALDAARRAGRRGAVAAHRRLGVERLLAQVERPEVLRAYVEEWLGPIERHGEGARAAAPLLATLEALVREGWNNRAAARRLHVHVNTLLYRLGRIEELSGRRLDDQDVRLALSLALRARQLVSASDRSSNAAGGDFG